MSHSGITLAALWGALASQEIVAQVRLLSSLFLHFLSLLGSRLGCSFWLGHWQPAELLGKVEPDAGTIPALLADYRPGRPMRKFTSSPHNLNPGGSWQVVCVRRHGRDDGLWPAEAVSSKIGWRGQTFAGWGAKSAVC